MRRLGVAVALSAGAVAVVASTALNGASEAAAHPKPAAEWIRCAHVSGYSAKDLQTDMSGVRYVDYQYAHSCTFRFSGATPQSVIFMHDHPNSD